MEEPTQKSSFQTSSFHRTTINLNKDLLHWYRETQPEGTLWLTINSLLKAYKEVYETNPPVDYAKLGAERLFNENRKL